MTNSCISLRSVRCSSKSTISPSVYQTEQFCFERISSDIVSKYKPKSFGWQQKYTFGFPCGVTFPLVLYFKYDICFSLLRYPFAFSAYNTILAKSVKQSGFINYFRYLTTVFDLKRCGSGDTYHMFYPATHLFYHQHLTNQDRQTIF